MNGESVGCLTLRAGRLSFTYSESWLQHPKTRPISLSIPLQTSENKNDEVHAYFDNLLPDSDQVRRHIVDSLGAVSTHPFDLLATLGADCVGALSFTKNAETNQNSKLELIPLEDEDIAQLIKQVRTGNVLGMQKDDNFRISLAGAQEKTALTFWEGRWHKPVGITATTHIFKLPINSLQQMGVDLSSSVENEWFCMRFMKHLGFKIPKVNIKNFGDEKVLVVSRFDRKLTDNTIIRLPQEDMCQALGVVSASKYQEHGGPGVEDIMALLKTSNNALKDQIDFMKAQVVFWLLAAPDGHAKNFSIFLRPEGFSLTPFYDVISAYPYFGQETFQKQKLKMAMAVYGKNTHYKWNTIMKRHWSTLAKKTGFSQNDIEAILNDLIEQVPIALQKTKDEIPDDFPMGISEQIEQGVLGCLDKLT